MGTETIKLPDMGEGVDSATVVSILVSEGDEIEKDQALMELETEKAVSEVPSPQAGKVAEIHVEKNQEVTEGDLLLTIETAEEEAEEEGAEDEPQDKQAEKDRQDEPKKEKQTAERKNRDKAEATEREQAEKKEPKKEADTETPEETGTRQKRQKKEKRKGEKPDADAGEAPESERARQESKKAEPAGTTYAPGSEIPAAPSTRRLARELGVDLHRVQPAGETGRIEEADVVAAARDASKTQAEREANQDEWGPIRRESLSSIRKRIARKMHESRQNAAQATNTDDADITELTEFYRQSKDVTDYDLSLLAFIFRAVTDALKQHPLLNASLDLEAGETVHKDYISIGMAVDTERGLVVPVIRNTDRKSISELTDAMKTTSERARSGELNMDDMQGGTFTVSNLGTIGGRYAIPIIHYPESAILLLGKARREPRVVEEEVEIRTVMPLSLSYDHRLIDGAEATRFLNNVVASLESPTRLLTQ